MGARDGCGSGVRWYVLRDLCRANAHEPAWRWLPGEGFEVFTPMHEVVSRSGGRTVRVKEPVLRDLLFVRAAREELDATLSGRRTLQYRWVRGGWMTPMTVPDAEMERFIRVSQCAEGCVKYFTPDELRPEMAGGRCRIVGGPLDGVEATLLKVRGARKKRVFVQIPSLLAASVEVSPELVQLLDTPSATDPQRGAGR